MIIKKKNAFYFLFFFMFFVFFTSSHWLPTKINNIYPSKENERKAIVLLDNPPLKEEEVISFWNNNKIEIINTLGGMETRDYILFLRNEIKKKLNVENEQICIPNLDDSCVSLDDRLFFVERKSNGFWIGFYESYGLNTCVVFVKDNGEKEYVNCNDKK